MYRQRPGRTKDAFRQVHHRAAPAWRTAASSACVDGRAASAARVAAKIARLTCALGDRAHDDARAAARQHELGQQRHRQPAGDEREADHRRRSCGGGCRARSRRARGRCGCVISSQPSPAWPVVQASPASSASGTASRGGAPRGAARAGRARTGSRSRSWRSTPAGQRARLVLPLVAEHEVDVAERERGQRLLGLGLDQLAAQPRRVARERLHRRQRRAAARPTGTPRCAPGRRRVPAAAARSASASAGALEQRVGVLDQHERGVGQPHAAAGALEQRHAGLALEHRELLGDGRRRELQRVGDRGDRAALVQLAQQAQAAEVEHRKQCY